MAETLHQQLLGAVNDILAAGFRLKTLDDKRIVLLAHNSNQQSFRDLQREIEKEIVMVLKQEERRDSLLRQIAEQRERLR